MRRRWKAAALALPLLVVAYELPRIPAIRSRGYAAAFPTLVLVLAADLGPTDLFDPLSSRPGPLLDEFAGRRPIPAWHGAVLNARIRLHARARGISEIPERLRQHHDSMHERTVDLTGLDEPTASAILRAIESQAGVPLVLDPPTLAEDAALRGPSAPIPAPGLFPAAEALALIFAEGDLNTRRIETRLTVDGLLVRDGWTAPMAGAPTSVIRTYGLREQIEVAMWPFDVEPPRRTGRVIFNGGGGASASDDVEAAQSDVIESIMRFVAFESWLENGGDIGIVFLFDRWSVTFKTTPAIHLEIERFLDEVLHPTPVTPDPPSGERANAHSPIRRTVVYDLEPILVAHRKGSRFERIVHDIVDEIVTGIDSLGWVDNGGDVSFLGTIGARLVVRTTPENHDAIRRYLHERLVDAGAPRP